MEYGEAINAESFERAFETAGKLSVTRPEMSIEQVAREAVRQSYCACVTHGEDAAEHRFSDVHRRLIEELAARLQTNSDDQRRSPSRLRTPGIDDVPACQDRKRNR